MSYYLIYIYIYTYIYNKTSYFIQRNHFILYLEYRNQRAADSSLHAHGIVLIHLRGKTDSYCVCRPRNRDIRSPNCNLLRLFHIFPDPNSRRSNSLRIGPTCLGYNEDSQVVYTSPFYDLHNLCLLHQV